MNQYIALLRGINISGKNKVAMPLLKTYFEQLGFQDVSTYINSGNVLFKSESKDTLKIQQDCMHMMIDKFNLSIPIAIISIEELKDTLAHAPSWWDVESEEETIHQTIFLISPTTIQEVLDSVKAPREQYEKVSYYKNTFFFSATRATLSKSNWYKIASSSVNNKVTIRNANTTKKLLALANEK